MTARGDALEVSAARWPAAAWPAVSARLCAALRVLGVPGADRDDIVQEVAARVLSARPTFTSADELYGWARTVGLRLSTADYRRARRFASAEFPEAAGPADVDGEVAGRLRLEAVLRELASLSPDRAAIAYELVGRPPDWDEAETLRWKVQRHRARERLLARLRPVAEGAGAAAVWLRRRWREALRLAEPSASAPLAVAAAWLVPLVGTAVVPLGTSEHARQAIFGRAAVTAGEALWQTATPDAPRGRPGPAPPSVSAAPVGVAHLPSPPATAPPPPPPTTVVWVDDAGGVGGGATTNDDDELKVCLEGFESEGVTDGCVVSLTPWTLLPWG